MRCCLYKLILRYGHSSSTYTPFRSCSAFHDPASETGKPPRSQPTRILQTLPMLTDPPSAVATPHISAPPNIEFAFPSTLSFSVFWSHGPTKKTINYNVVPTNISLTAPQTLVHIRTTAALTMLCLNPSFFGRVFGDLFHLHQILFFAMKKDAAYLIATYICLRTSSHSVRHLFRKIQTDPASLNPLQIHASYHWPL